MATDRTIAYYTGSTPSGYDATYTSWSTLISTEDLDLITNNRRLIVEITGFSGGDANRCGVWDGAVCDYSSGQYILIRPKSGEEPDFSSGFDTSAFYINQNGSECVYLDNDHDGSSELSIVFQDLQFRVHTTTAILAYSKFSAYYDHVIFERCWFEGMTSESLLPDGSYSSRLDVINVVFDGGSHGINVLGTMSDQVRLVNVTATGISDDALESGNKTVHAINCAVFNNADDFRDSFSTIDYCASDDGDGTNAINWDSEATDWNNNFTDYSNGDYNVKDTSADIYQAGASQNDYAYVPSDDIAGTARPTGSNQVSIGAYEYVAAGPTAKSVDGSAQIFSATLSKKLSAKRQVAGVI